MKCRMVSAVCKGLVKLRCSNCFKTALNKEQEKILHCEEKISRDKWCSGTSECTTSLKACLSQLLSSVQLHTTGHAK